MKSRWATFVLGIFSAQFAFAHSWPEPFWVGQLAGQPNGCEVQASDSVPLEILFRALTLVQGQPATDIVLGSLMWTSEGNLRGVFETRGSTSVFDFGSQSVRGEREVTLRMKTRVGGRLLARSPNSRFVLVQKSDLSGFQTRDTPTPPTAMATLAQFTVIDNGASPLKHHEKSGRAALTLQDIEDLRSPSARAVLSDDGLFLLNQGSQHDSIWNLETGQKILQIPVDHFLTRLEPQDARHLTAVVSPKDAAWIFLSAEAHHPEVGAIHRHFVVNREGLIGRVLPSIMPIASYARKVQGAFSPDGSEFAYAFLRPNGPGRFSDVIVGLIDLRLQKERRVGTIEDRGSGLVVSQGGKVLNPSPWDGPIGKEPVISWQSDGLLIRAHGLKILF